MKTEKLDSVAADRDAGHGASKDTVAAQGRPLNIREGNNCGGKSVAVVSKARVASDFHDVRIRLQQKEIKVQNVGQEAEPGAVSVSPVSSQQITTSPNLDLGVLAPPSMQRTAQNYIAAGAFAMAGAEYQGSGDLEANNGDQLNSNREDFLGLENSTEDASLAVAKKVDDHGYLARAEDVDISRMKERAKERSSGVVTRSILLAVAVVVATIAIILVVALTFAGSKNNGEKNKGTNHSTVDNSVPPTKEVPVLSLSHDPESYILSLLPRSSRDAITRNDTSAQSLAFDWILHDPLLQNYTMDYRIVQRFVLATLFYATGGANKKLDDETGESLAGWFHDENWLSYDEHECNWWHQDDIGGKIVSVTEFARQENLENKTLGPCGVKGDSLEPGSDAYQHLWLWELGLEGSIPPELYLLTTLRSLSLFANRLDGTISTSIGQLQKLELLQLQNNDLSGPIPSEIGSMKELTDVFFFSNPITGSIPSEIGDLSNLVVFQQDNSLMTGTIPSEFGRLANLSITILGDFLTGTVPTEMGMMSRMRQLDTTGNHLTGMKCFEKETMSPFRSLTT